MAHVLDTDVISEARKAISGKADTHVLAWSNGLAADLFFLTAIVVTEFELGVRRIGRRDPAQGRPLRQWLDYQLLETFSDRILAVDAAVARECARLHDPDPRADRDALFASTAIVHGMTVATRNTADSEATSIALIDP